MPKLKKGNVRTYDEWQRELFIEDAELTGGAVPRTTKQLKRLWEIYKDYQGGLYSYLPGHYG
tara:strand:+ start:916 stop:1101 length:186 start_codon:yes stop_codon:yes gene_type:complete